MSLTKCRECDGQVSTEAATCPHCGCPRPWEEPDAVSNDDLAWSDWFSLEDLARVKDLLPRGGGVYRFRLEDSHGSPRPCDRFLDKDESGVIYIGRSKSNLRARVLKVAEGRETGKELTHTLGRKLHILDRLPNFRSDCEDLQLMVQAAFASDPVAAEKQLLKEYQARFGEVPPLNGEFKGRGDIEYWKDFID